MVVKNRADLCVHEFGLSHDLRRHVTALPGGDLAVMKVCGFAHDLVPVSRVIHASQGGCDLGSDHVTGSRSGSLHVGPMEADPPSSQRLALADARRHGGSVVDSPVPRRGPVQARDLGTVRRRPELRVVGALDHRACQVQLSCDRLTHRVSLLASLRLSAPQALPAPICDEAGHHR